MCQPNGLNYDSGKCADSNADQSEQLDGCHRNDNIDDRRSDVNLLGLPVMSGGKHHNIIGQTQTMAGMCQRQHRRKYRNHIVGILNAGGIHPYKRHTQHRRTAEQIGHTGVNCPFCPCKGASQLLPLLPRPKLSQQRLNAADHG